MNSFENLNPTRPLLNALADLKFSKPTPIQTQAFPVVLSGKDVVGIAQTGTGKTLAYMLPILHDLKFSKQVNPRVMIIVPTRELVLQLVDMIATFTKYMTVRVVAVYGGTNVNKQMQALMQGSDIVVATPGLVYDLAISKVLQLKGVKKLVIDEVDVMLDLGFRVQLKNIFSVMPERRQNIMFSATMTEEVDNLLEEYFITPTRISIAVSGTPLANIAQVCYPVQNFFTKVNLLIDLLRNKSEYEKVLVFVSNKTNADRVFDLLEENFGSAVCVIHSNKSQNYRVRSLEEFESGQNRILVATDVVARGLDLSQISHVINFDTPIYPENYMHRIGRTGRAENQGKSILFFTPTEEEFKLKIEELMSYKIPQLEFPEDVEVSQQLLPEEKPRIVISKNRKNEDTISGEAFHEKKLKNTKVNLGGSYHREIVLKYKKPKTRGDKNANRKKKK